MNALHAMLSRYRVSTDPLYTERRVELAAAILSVVLLLLLLYTVLRLVLNAEPVAILPAPDTLQVGELQRLGMVSPVQSDELRARPVFWPSRRPVVEASNGAATVAKIPKAKQKNELDKVTVLGVFGSGETAVVIAQVEGKKRRIMLGDKVVGWTLKSVERGTAEFVDAGRSATLALDRTTIASGSQSPQPRKTNKEKKKTLR